MVLGFWKKKSPRSGGDGKRRPQSEMSVTMGAVMKTDHLTVYIYIYIYLYLYLYIY